MKNKVLRSGDLLNKVQKCKNMKNKVFRSDDLLSKLY